MGRIALPVVDSTNAEGFRRLADHPAPFWVLGGTQTAGRGRRARPWSSPPGNFYATLMIETAQAPQIVALRSFVAALALREALVAATGTAAGLALKWPNDVLMNGGKVAGILLEAQGSTLAIGIGVNLLHHPPITEVGSVTPVSVLPETGARLTPEAFLDHLAPAYATLEARFTTEGFAPIRAEWLAHAARLGEPIRARTGDQTRHGIFESIDAHGNLMLRMAAGLVAIPAAEVFF